MRQIARLVMLVLFPAVLVLGACNSAGVNPPDGNGPIDQDPDNGGGGGENPDGSINSVDDQLRELGIDHIGIASANRQLGNGLVAGDDYSPLGMRARVAPMELFAVGVSGSCAGASADGVLSMPMFNPANGTWINSSECYTTESGVYEVDHRAQPSSGFRNPGAQSSRAAAVGDFDGDGIQEAVVVVADHVPGINQWVLLSYLTNAGAPGTISDEWLPGRTELSGSKVVDIETTVGDFNGNGLDDLLVAVVQDNEDGDTDRELTVLVYQQTEPGVMSSAETVYRTQMAAGTDHLSVRLESGNLDVDAQHEFVFLLRSMEEGTGANPTTEVTYWIFDDLATPVSGNRTPISTGRPQNTAAGGSPYLTADIAIGDFDGDGLDELAFTGIISRSSMETCRGDYVLGYEIFDDMANAANKLVSLGARTEEQSIGDCTSGGRGGYVYEVFAEPINFSGGYTKELLANDMIFRLDGSDLELVKELAATTVYASFNSEFDFSEATTSITVGDFNNDGRDEVAVWSTGAQGLVIMGNDFPARTIDVGGTRSEQDYPELLAYDNDDDGLTVEFQVGSHEVLLTEPVIIAALAAAPYDVDLGQDPAAAVTSYGTSRTSGNSAETTVSFTAQSMIGVTVGGSFGPIELSATTESSFEKAVENSQGTGYSVTYTKTYEASVEDSVVFTSFPYDVYHYTIVNSYDSTMLGDTFTIMLPRSPETMIASASFYDASIPPDGIRLSDTVFRHTAGEPESYRTYSETLQLRDSMSGGNRPSTFLMSDGLRAGQGNSTVTATIELSREEFHTEAVGYTREHGLSMTGGNFTAGFSVGSGESESLTISSGTSTIVSGTVPSTNNADPQHPNANFEFGLYTYMQRFGDNVNPGQLFQVVNYWVHR